MKEDLIKSKLITRMIKKGKMTRFYCITPLGITYLMLNHRVTETELLKRIVKILNYFTCEKNRMDRKIWNKIEKYIGARNILYPVMNNACTSIHIQEMKHNEIIMQQTDKGLFPKESVEKNESSELVTLNYSVSGDLEIILMKFAIKNKQIKPIVTKFNEKTEWRDTIEDNEFFSILSTHIMNVFCYVIVIDFLDGKKLLQINRILKGEEKIIARKAEKFYKNLERHLNFNFTSLNDTKKIFENIKKL